MVATGKRGVRHGWAEQQSEFWYLLAVRLVGLLLGVWVRRYRAVGADMVPATGGAFLIANHTSGMDPFLLGYPVQHRRPSGPGKVELFRNPVFGYLMRKIGMFPIKQGVADTGAVRAMVELYRKGRIVIVYPEGGRSDSGELRPFFSDFARLVIKLRAPVVPAAIAGARDLLPVGSLIPRPNMPVAVVFGEPFELSEFYGGTLTEEMTVRAAALMHERVAALLVRAWQERAQL